MATEKLDFFAILSESAKITRSHSRHFLALSVLFLLPLSFSIIALPTLHRSLTDPSAPPPPQILLKLTFQHHPIALTPLFFSLFYALVVLALLLSSVATITHSLHNGFFGRPVKLALAIKSLSNSLLKLFATFLCGGIIVLGSVMCVGLLVFGLLRGIEELGFEIGSSRVFQWVGAAVLGLGLLWLCINWVLAPVVVVVESTWGLEPLRRSAHLVNGMRGVVVSLLLYFGAVLSISVWQCWGTTVGSGVWADLWFIVVTVLGSAVLVLFSMQGVAANAMLYMNCKAVHGELAGEIVEEFAQEYVSLPFDEAKVPRLVSILHP